MPEIQIRPAEANDIPKLVELDHDYVSDYVWQMDVNQTDDEQILVTFRQVHLPRSIKVDYPRSPASLAEDWSHRSGLLVAVLQGEVIGYISLMLDIAPLTTWVTDLAVVRKYRRQGVGSALLIAAQEWGRKHHTSRLVLEMQPKNYPAISQARKLGFGFCGYNDRYYPNHDIAIFFEKILH